MENRNITQSINEVNDAIDSYSEEICDLRHTAAGIADEVLGRHPSFWSENFNATLSVLNELDSIIKKRDNLDNIKDKSINKFSIETKYLNE